jgi:hypothetical protein
LNPERDHVTIARRLSWSCFHGMRSIELAVSPKTAPRHAPSAISCVIIGHHG